MRHARVALCLDSESVNHPELIGLADEDLCSQPWLDVVTDATTARLQLPLQPEISEVWVAGNDEIDAINLAAAIQSQHPYADVFLIEFDCNGSLLTRAHAANLDGVLDSVKLALRYAHWKTEYAKQISGLVDDADNDLTMRGHSEKKKPVTRRESTRLDPLDAWRMPHRAFDKDTIADAQTNSQIFGSLPHSSSRALEPIERLSGDISNPQEQKLQTHTSRHMQDASYAHNASCAQDTASMNPVFPDVDAKDQQRKAKRFIADSHIEKANQNTRSTHALSHDGGIRHMLAHVANGPGKSYQGYVLSIVGAQGGIGKSSIAALAGIFSVGYGLKTLVLDADLQFGDVASLLGISNPTTITDVLNDPALVERLVPENRKPAVLAPPHQLEDSEIADMVLAELLEGLKVWFDVIIVNTSSLWSDLHIRLLKASSNAVFVIDQRSSAVASCRRVLSLCTRCGIASRPFAFALNNCARNALLTGMDVSCALQKSPISELSDGGREVDELLGAGLALELIDSHNSFCISLENLLAHLLPQEQQTAKEKPDKSAKKKKLKLFGKGR